MKYFKGKKVALTFLTPYSAKQKKVWLRRQKRRIYRRYSVEEWILDHQEKEGIKLFALEIDFWSTVL